MPADAAFCPGCGRPMRTETSAQGKVGPLPVNLAGALAYFSFVPAIVFLFVGPYRKNRFVRFHAMQSILFFGGLTVIRIILGFIGALGLPFLGFFVGLLGIAVGIIGLVGYILLLINGFQGKYYKLPIVGDYAEKYANQGM